MPWQAVPSLLIIAGAFNVAAGLIWTIDQFNPQKVGAVLRHDLCSGCLVVAGFCLNIGS
jgi:hypothetical protein